MSEAGRDVARCEEALSQVYVSLLQEDEVERGSLVGVPLRIQPIQVPLSPVALKRLVMIVSQFDSNGTNQTV